LLLAGCAGLNDAEPASLHLPAGGTRVTKPVVSWRELQHQNVVMQGADYSCGSGSLATIMRYYFEDEVTELEILNRILSQLGPQEYAERVKNGLSLLDLKECAIALGYQAVGVRLPYSALPKLQGPIVVHVDRDGLEHFVVLKGVRGNRVFLADPSWGNMRMSIDRFAQEWTGVGLILGKEGFGLPAEHALALDDVQAVPPEVLAARRALYRTR
jgi:predicted double-glycine peptidase